MIIPKRKASDYQRPEIVNEFDEIHKYIQEKRTLREIQVIMEGRMSDEAIEKLYIRVLKEIRRAKDRQRGFIIIGLIFLSIGLWLSLRNISNILHQMRVKTGDENFYVKNSFFEFAHPFWLLIFGTMVVSGLILVLTNLFQKPRI